MSLIIKAAKFAKKAHDGQFRKYSNVKFVMHPGRVAARVSMVDGVTEEIVAACWCHDTREDCDVSRDELVRELGLTSANLVEEVTNPSKQHPELSRAKRKEMDRDHIAQISHWGKVIKLADRIDNLRDIGCAPKDFLKLYCEESVDLLESLLGIDEELEKEYVLALHYASSIK